MVISLIATLSLLLASVHVDGFQQASDSVKTKTYHIPEGPFRVIRRLYNSRTGIVFQVKDNSGTDYSLKVFVVNEQKGDKKSTNDTDVDESTEVRAKEFTSERLWMASLTQELCPELILNIRHAYNGEKHEKEVVCPYHHIQVLLALDVRVLEEGTNGTRKGMMDMMIPNYRGELKERRLNFGLNVLMPYMAGGRLNDILARTPKYQSVVMRYPLYVDVAPQLVDALRFMHSKHIVHLGVQTTAVICSDDNCSDVVLAEPSRAWGGSGPLVPVAANELMQESVRFTHFIDEDHQGPEYVETPRAARSVVPTFIRYMNESHGDWKGTLSVDWYALGGTLMYILGGSRPVAEDRQGPNSRDAAEFIYKALQSNQVLSKVPSEKAREALARLRDQVADGLLLVDGLLQVDRSKRISFDDVPGAAATGHAKMAHAAKRLRAGKVLMSALQTDSLDEQSSCLSYIRDTPKQSSLLEELTVDEAKLPQFVQDLCVQQPQVSSS